MNYDDHWTRSGLGTGAVSRKNSHYSRDVGQDYLESVSIVEVVAVDQSSKMGANNNDVFVDITTKFVADVLVPGDIDHLVSIVTHRDGVYQGYVDKDMVQYKHECLTINRNPKYLTSFSQIKPETKEDYKCYFTEKDPKFIASITYPNQPPKVNNVELHQSSEENAINVITLNPKYLASIIMPTDPRKQVQPVKPPLAPKPKNVVMMAKQPKTASTWRCNFVNKNPTFLASISYPATKPSCRSGRTSLAPTPGKMSGYMCYVTQQNPQFLASIGYPVRPAPKTKQFTNDDFVPEMQNFSKDKKEKSILDSLVSNKLLWMTSYHEENERSRGGGMIVNMNHGMELEDSSAFSSDETYESENTNSQPENDHFTRKISDEKPKKTKRKPLEQANPLSFEEMGKIYTSISRRKILSKVIKF